MDRSTARRYRESKMKDRTKVMGKVTRPKNSKAPIGSPPKTICACAVTPPLACPKGIFYGALQNSCSISCQKSNLIK